MKQIIIFLTCLVNIPLMAQDLMRITKADGSYWDFSINNVKDMDFQSQQPVNIIGEWFIHFEKEDVTEIDIFNVDGTFTSQYSYNASLGQRLLLVENRTDGTYTVADNVINCYLPNGELYRTIFIKEYSDYRFVAQNEITFHKLRDTYYMTTDNEPIVVGNDGDIIRYADNVFCEIQDNKIKALTGGTGVFLVEDEHTKEQKAYKVEIEYIDPPLIYWTNYFNKSLTDIQAEFGEPELQDDSQHTKTYTCYNAAIIYVTFTFTDDWNRVKDVVVSFYKPEYQHSYINYIEENYFFYKKGAGIDLYVNANASLAIFVVRSENWNYIKYVDETVE